MKKGIIILVIVAFAGAGFWLFNSRDSKPNEENLTVDTPVVIKKSTDIQVREIDDEVKAYLDQDYETLLLKLFPAEGYVGKDLYKRLEYLQKWLDSLKVFIVHTLDLDVRYYADYIEYRYQFTQNRLRQRESLKKRYGDYESFSKAYQKIKDEVHREYFDKLEELFGDSFDDIVKFNTQFNDKIKSEHIDRYSDELITVEI